MVYDYYEATQDLDFVTKMLPTLEKEFTFWKTQRQMPVTVNGKTYQVYRYHSPTNMPRAESYDLDVIKAENVSDPSTFYNVRVSVRFNHNCTSARRLCCRVWLGFFLTLVC